MSFCGSSDGFNDGGGALRNGSSKLVAPSFTSLRPLDQWFPQGFQHLVNLSFCRFYSGLTLVVNTSTGIDDVFRVVITILGGSADLGSFTARNSKTAQGFIGTVFQVLCLSLHVSENPAARNLHPQKWSTSEASA